MQPTLFFKCEACGGYFDGRDLGAVLEHEEPLPHPGMRSSAVSLQDHRRGGVRRRDGGGTTRPYKFERTHEAALGVASLNSAPCSSL
jgi:hypothetical protein